MMESLVYGIGFILLAIFGLVWYLHSFVKLGKDLAQIADVLDAGLEGSDVAPV